MRASKLLPRILKFVNYANLCTFIPNQWKMLLSVISWPILILFVLSDRAWCGLQNFYTEFWNSLIMQIYANLFKINEKGYFSVISWPIWILFVLSDRAWCGLQNFYTEFWNSKINYANLCKILFKINEKCHLSSLYSEITTDLHLRRGRILRIAQFTIHLLWGILSASSK